MDVFQTIFPNVLNKSDELINSCYQTLYMISISGIISFIIGLFFGVTLTITAPGKILENKVIHPILDKSINLLRSIPFIILLAALIPLTRWISGTAIGTKGAILPLVFGTVPFFIRQVQSVLAEVDHGLIEAAQSMGDTPFEIIQNIYLRESIPGLIRASAITLTSLVGLTTMAGAVGGGGLGDFAIRYGHQRNQSDITWVTVIILLAGISLIQQISSHIINKTTH